ncbi:MAG: DUF72 domain-containing protein [Chthonomonadales bacterium]
MLIIGTSGWTYGNWAHSFFAGVPRNQWIQHYSRIFNGVEVNSTFYHAVRASTFESWARQTHPQFHFALKGSRLVTHVRRLRDVRDVLLDLKERAKPLGPKLSAVVWQLPRSFQQDLERLASFVGDLASWPEARHVIEFRHPSWFTPQTAHLLTQALVANCISDAADWPMWPAVTADLVYVRLHGHERTYRSPYTEEELRSWADRLRAWLEHAHSVQVFFDNTDEGHAPANALRLAELMQNEPRNCEHLPR